MKIKEIIVNLLRSNIYDGKIEKWIAIVLQAITIGIFMGYVAIQHNPQEEYVNIENGTVNILYFLETVTPWIIGTLIFCAIISGISRLLIKSFRSMLNKKT